LATNAELKWWTAFVSIMIVAGLVAWFYFRGDLYADQWVTSFFGE
jgi:hypothetical protein